MYDCACGSRVTFSNNSNHFKSVKHRKFMEEPNATTSLRKSNQQSSNPATLSYCINNKVENLNDEQLEVAKRREYYENKVREHRANKKPRPKPKTE